MIRRTLMLSAVLLAAVCLGAGAAAPARASSPDEQMREALLALRGLIDREGAARWFTYPTRRTVRCRSPRRLRLAYEIRGREPG